MSPRLPYEDLALEYIEDIIENGIFGVVGRMSERWGVADEGVRSRVRRAMERGEFPPHIRVPTFTVEHVLKDMAKWRDQPIGHVQVGQTPTSRIYFDSSATTQDELDDTAQFASWRNGPWAIITGKEHV